MLLADPSFPGSERGSGLPCEKLGVMAVLAAVCVDLLFFRGPFQCHYTHMVLGNNAEVKCVHLDSSGDQQPAGTLWPTGI